MKTFNTLTDPMVADLLGSGHIGILPTDTLYGLVARAADEAAVSKLYSVKPREGKPGTIIASYIEQLVELGLKRRYLKAVEHYWPSPISIIIPCGSELSYLHQGQQSLAVRISSAQKLNTLINQTGPLLTTSANKPGAPPADTIARAKDYFGESVDFYVEGGNMSGSLPSTVMRVVDDAVEVLRQGAVKIDEKTGAIKQ